MGNASGSHTGLQPRVRSLPRDRNRHSHVFAITPTTNELTSSTIHLHSVNPANCSALPLRPPTNCAKNAVFTHDYPGWFSQELSQLSGGGEVLYFNGAIGVQIGNHGPVWEVDATHPLGNGGTVPPGAEIVPENYRRAYLIGTQLASFVKYVYSLSLSLSLSLSPPPHCSCCRSQF